MDKILTEISAGELFDKISILEIKKVKISNIILYNFATIWEECAKFDEYLSLEQWESV